MCIFKEKHQKLKEKILYLWFNKISYYILMFVSSLFIVVILSKYGSSMVKK